MTATALPMSRADCLAQLRTHAVGRIAVTSQALPAVVPVNYRVSGNHIVFRTVRGGMVARACDGAVVAFEIDHLAPDGWSGWSVLVVGIAEHLDGSAAVRALETGVASAIGEGTDTFIGIAIAQVTGRVVEPVRAPTAEPTVGSTAEPTIEPTVRPTAEPTAEPTAVPRVGLTLDAAAG